MNTEFDLVVSGGRIIDPAAGTSRRADIGVRAGKVVAVQPELNTAGLRIDATGGFVSLGWIDIHTHVFASGFPIAVTPDEAGVDSGVTTVVDAGSSGYITYRAFRAADIAPARTNVLTFLHLCATGMLSLASGVGELHTPELADVDGLVRCIAHFPGEIAGIKLRLARNVSAAPDLLLRRALDAAAETDRPLMVHLTDSVVPLREVLDLLRPGDIVTHAFHPRGEGLLDADSRVQPWVIGAQARGINFDVGHAGTLFDTEICRRAADGGFWPDTLSTDAHNPDPGVVSPTMAGVMSTFLALGMSLEQVIACATTAPARVIGRAHQREPWRIGIPADLTVFRLADGTTSYGSGGEHRSSAGRHIEVIATILSGVPHNTYEAGANTPP